MKSIIRTLFTFSAFFLFALPAQAARFEIESGIDHIYQDANGNATGCYRVYTVIWHFDDDGTKTYVASGHSNIGTNCPPKEGGAPPTQNPNCPAYECDGVTFYTSSESRECFGQIICDNHLFELYETSIEELLGEVGGNKEGNSTGFSDGQNAPNEKLFAVYPNPLASSTREFSIDIRMPLARQQSPSIVEVFDPVGKSIYRFPLKAGVQQLKVVLPSSAGIYKVVLSNSDKVLQTEQVVQR